MSPYNCPAVGPPLSTLLVVDHKDELLACDAARRACERLPARRPFLMPTN